MNYSLILGIILVIFLSINITHAIHIAEVRYSNRSLICHGCGKQLQGKDTIYVIGIYEGDTLYCAECHLSTPLTVEENNYYSKMSAKEYIKEYGNR